MVRDWWRRRQEREAEHDAARQRLYSEYVERLEAGDPHALESSRDYGDHDKVPWRTEVTMGLAVVAVLALMVVVVALVAFFAGIQRLTAG